MHMTRRRDNELEQRLAVVERSAHGARLELAALSDRQKKAVKREEALRQKMGQLERYSASLEAHAMAQSEVQACELVVAFALHKPVTFGQNLPHSGACTGARARACVWSGIALLFSRCTRLYVHFACYSSDYPYVTANLPRPPTSGAGSSSSTAPPAGHRAVVSPAALYQTGERLFGRLDPRRLWKMSLQNM